MDSEAKKKALCEWDVSTGCANHDCQNSLDWCLRPTVSDAKDTVKRLYVVCKSLRDGFSLVADGIVSFVNEKLSYDPEPWDHQEVYAFWSAFGLMSEVADELARINLRYSGGRLLCGIRTGSLEERRGVAISALKDVFKFRTFTESRWLSIGSSTRALTASLLLGLDGVLSMIRAKPENSDWYIGGVAHLSADARRYAVVASLAAVVPDVVLLELMEDDRLALKARAVWRQVIDELQWLAGLHSRFWIRLAGVLTGTTPDGLRQLVLLAGNTSAAYMHRKTFTVAFSYPWRLCEGDIDMNLTKLIMLAKPPGDKTAQKIHDMVMARWPRAELVEAIRLLGDCHWSTNHVEQGHASAATMHKEHKMYGMEMITARALVHQCRKLLPDQEVQHRVLRLHERLAALRRRQPYRITGRHAFLKYISQPDINMDGPARKAMAEQIMKVHASCWHELSDEEKAYWNHKSVDLNAERESELIEVRHVLQQRLDLAQSQLAVAPSGQLQMSNCRWSSLDLEEIALMYNSEEFPRTRVEDLRSRSVESPVEPDRSTKSEFEDMDIGERPHLENETVEWCKLLALHRDYFEGAVVCVTFNDQEVWAKLLYGTISPRQCTFLRLIPAEGRTRRAGQCLPADMLMLCGSAPDLVFEYNHGDIVVDSDICGGQAEVDVFMHSELIGRDKLYVYGGGVPLAACARGLPAAKSNAQKQKKSTAKTAEERAWDEIRRKHKWVKEFDSDDEGAAPSTARPEEVDIGEEARTAVYALLRQERAEWHTEERRDSEHFKTTTRGGAWCMAHYGVPYNEARGQRSGKAVAKWCKRYGLSQSMTCGFSVIPREVAYSLAKWWTVIMDYYYSLYVAMHLENYTYEESDHDGRPNDVELRARINMLPAGDTAYIRLMQLDAIRPGPALRRDL